MSTTPPLPPQQPQPPQVVVVQQQPTHRRTRHGLHAFLTAVTFGAWAPVWIVRWLINRNV